MSEQKYTIEDLQSGINILISLLLKEREEQIIEESELEKKIIQQSDRIAELEKIIKEQQDI